MQKRVGYWWADKKEKDVPSDVLRKFLSEHNIQLVKLDLSRSFADQGPFLVIVHKLCDLLIKEIGGDSNASQVCKQFEAYCASRPWMRVLDPLSSVRSILDRYAQYELVRSSLKLLGDSTISVPSFVRLDSPADPTANVDRVYENGLKYPLLCKQIVAHGSREAHRMYLILNERGLRELKIFPCVIQQFIPHGSVLYKAYVVGSSFSIIKRPSLKDVSTSSHLEDESEHLIEFNSHDVSKPDSKSPLTDSESWLRESEEDCKGEAGSVVLPRWSDRLTRAVNAVRIATGQTLYGIDFIISTTTKDNDQILYIIDVNNFPGYAGMDNFMPAITRLITSSARDAEKHLAKQEEEAGKSMHLEIACGTNGTSVETLLSPSNNILQHVDVKQIQSTTATTNGVLH